MSQARNNLRKCLGIAVVAVMLMITVYPMMVAERASASTEVVGKSNQWQGYMPNEDAVIDQTISTYVEKAETSGKGRVSVAATVNNIDFGNPEGGATVAIDTVAVADSRLMMGFDSFGPYTPVSRHSGYANLPGVLTRTEMNDDRVAGEGYGWWVNLTDTSNNNYYVNFFGAYYGRAWISSNGFISFDSRAQNTPGGEWTTGNPRSFPDAQVPNCMVAGLWRDLYFDPSAGSQIRYGMGAYGSFVVAWINMRNTADNSLQTFAIYMYRYVSATLDGNVEIALYTYSALSGTVIGLEDQSGINYCQMAAPGSVPGGGKYWSFIQDTSNDYRVKNIRVCVAKGTDGSDGGAYVTIEGLNDLHPSGMNIQDYYDNAGNDGGYDWATIINAAKFILSAAGVGVQVLLYTGIVVIPGLAPAIAVVGVVLSGLSLAQSLSPAPSVPADQGIGAQETKTGFANFPCKEDAASYDPLGSVGSYPWYVETYVRFYWRLNDLASDHTLRIWAETQFVDWSGSTKPLNTDSTGNNGGLMLTLHGENDVSSGTSNHDTRAFWEGRTYPDGNFYRSYIGWSINTYNGVSSEGTTATGYHIMGWTKLQADPNYDLMTSSEGAIKIAGRFFQYDNLPTGLAPSERKVNAYVFYSPPDSANYDGTLSNAPAATAQILSNSDSNGGSTTKEVVISGLLPSKHIKVAIGRPVASNPAYMVQAEWSGLTVTSVCRPSAPQSFQASAIGETSITVSWLPPVSDGGTAITSYKLYMGTTPNGEIHSCTVGSSVRSMTFPDLTEGTTYYFKVTAVNAVGEGPFSNEISATTLFSDPLAPRNLVATAGLDKIDLSWLAPTSNGGSPITNYRVYRGTSSNGETLRTVLGNVLSYVDTGLDYGVTYYYKVTAVNSIGEGPPSNEASAIVLVVPSAPQNPVATAGNLKVTLTWALPASNGGTPITSYKIYKGTTSGGETYLASLTDLSVLRYVDSAVVNGVAYYYQVSAVNVIGEGPKSSEVSGMPHLTAPSAPTNLRASSGNAEIALRWDAPIDNGGLELTAYRIYRGTTDGGESFIASVGTTVFEYWDGGLTNGVRYFYRVTAENSLGEGAYSAINERPGLPGIPRNLEAIASVDGHVFDVVLTWDAPVSDGGSAISQYQICIWPDGPRDPYWAYVDGNTMTWTDGYYGVGDRPTYEVRAANSIDCGPFTDPLTLVIGPCSKPLNLAAEMGDSQLTLTWSPPAFIGPPGLPIASYTIMCGLESGGETLLTTVGASTLTYIHTGLTNGVKYYYRVYATNSFGPGALSDEVWEIPLGPPTAPQNLAAAAGDCTVTLTWTAPASDGGTFVSSWKVYRGTAPGGETYVKSLKGFATGFLDMYLTNGVTYYYKISAVNSVGESPLSNEASATPMGVPLAPSIVQISPGNAQVYFKWSAPADNGGSPITEYKMYRGLSSGSETYQRSFAPTVTEFTDAGLSNGVTYYYKVTAANIVGEGSGATFWAIPFTAPSAPLNLVATPGNAEVVLTWSAPANNGGFSVLGYDIYRGTSSGSETYLTTVSAPTATYTDTSLTNGVKYYYKVLAYSQGGSSPFSNEASATPTGTVVVPGAPQGLTAVSVSGGVKLTWTPPASDGGGTITAYKVYRGTRSGQETLYATLGSVLTYTDTGVTSGKKYYYQVSAVNSAGEGARCTEVTCTFTPPTTPPTAPQNLVAAPGNGQVKLTWAAPSSNGGSTITAYKIYRGTTAGGETYLTQVSGTTLTYTNTGLTNGVTYYYKVTAVNAVGEGPYSNEASATPTSATVPGAPTNLVASGTTTGIHLTWSAPSNGGSPITAYNIYRSTRSGAETLYKTVSASSTVYDDTGVTKGKTYYYKVTAVNAIGESAKSNEAFATYTGGAIAAGVISGVVSPNPLVAVEPVALTDASAVSPSPRFDVVAVTGDPAAARA